MGDEAEEAAFLGAITRQLVQTEYSDVEKV
jgi:hypothetical protein